MSDLSTPDKEQNDTGQSRRSRDKNFRVNLGRKLVTLRFKSSLQCSNKLLEVSHIECQFAVLKAIFPGIILNIVEY